MNETTARVMLGLGVPAVLGAIGFGSFLVLKSELPAPLAAHFTSSGVPDGSMSAGAFMAVNGVLFAIGLVCCVAIGAIAKPLGGMTAAGVASVGGFLCGFASGIMLETALSQRGLSSWTEASFSWFYLLLALALGLVGAAAAARLAAMFPSQQLQRDDAVRPVMDLTADEHAVWNATLHSTVLSTVGVFAILFAVFMAFATSRWFVVGVVALSALAIISLSSLKVRVDRVGLRVKYGLLPWPRTHIQVADIEAATVIDVCPMQWGGWGYRGSLKLMNQAAVVLRAGPGIRLDLRNGKVFVVTIDDPENAVALLNAEVARTVTPSV